MTTLRDLLHWANLSPFAINILVSQFMLLYFKVALETIAWWHSIEHHRPQHTTASISRPCIHLVLSSCVVFWPLFDVTDWSWRLNTLVPAALLARFIYKGAWCKNLAAVLIYLGQYHFMTTRAVVLAAALGVGDGWAAPVIGSRYGRHVYQIPLASPKSMEGSVVGVLLGTVSGCYLYLYLSGLPFLPLRVLLSYGAIAAVVEGTSPGSLDNLMISLVLLCTMDRVQDWLPG
jgi:dolichol kinase